MCIGRIISHYEQTQLLYATPQPNHSTSPHKTQTVDSASTTTDQRAAALRTEVVRRLKRYHKFINSKLCYGHGDFLLCLIWRSIVIIYFSKNHSNKSKILRKIPVKEFLKMLKIPQNHHQDEEIPEEFIRWLCKALSVVLKVLLNQLPTPPTFNLDDEIRKSRGYRKLDHFHALVMKQCMLNITSLEVKKSQKRFKEKSGDNTLDLSEFDKNIVYRAALRHLGKKQWEKMGRSASPFFMLRLFEGFIKLSLEEAFVIAHSWEVQNEFNSHLPMDIKSRFLMHSRKQNLDRLVSDLATVHEKKGFGTTPEPTKDSLIDLKSVDNISLRSDFVGEVGNISVASLDFVEDHFRRLDVDGVDKISDIGGEGPLRRDSVVVGDAKGMSLGRGGVVMPWDRKGRCRRESMNSRGIGDFI